MSISAKMALWSERPGMVSILFTAFGVLVSNRSRKLFLPVGFRLDWQRPASSKTPATFSIVLHFFYLLLIYHIQYLLSAYQWKITVYASVGVSVNIY